MCENFDRSQLRVRYPHLICANVWFNWLRDELRVEEPRLIVQIAQSESIKKGMPPLNLRQRMIYWQRVE
ncbi:hypothetical protein PCCS19_47900 [Paenibacillus sp. CCS19]|nr:hypothetical protein PCCS19_47900 [Paenibacillus cellulosilyticus]